MSSPALYSAVLGSVFILGAAGLAALAVYLLERIATRRRPKRRPADPYAEAHALAVRLATNRGNARRTRVPAPVRTGAPWL